MELVLHAWNNGYYTCTYYRLFPLKMVVKQSETYMRNIHPIEFKKKTEKTLKSVCMYAYWPAEYLRCHLKTLTENYNCNSYYFSYMICSRYLKRTHYKYYYFHSINVMEIYNQKWTIVGTYYGTSWSLDWQYIYLIIHVRASFTSHTLI